MSGAFRRIKIDEAARLMILDVVDARQADLHCRYVAHVFYAFNNRGIGHTFSKGRYLNQELIDKGFAKAV